MSSINRKMAVSLSEVTHGGAAVRPISAEKQLRRSVLASMLFEGTFYEDGQSHADRVKSLVAQVPAEVVGQLMIDARSKYNLRHVPLFLARELARLGKLKAEVLTATIQRADEIGEFLAHYWADGKAPLSNQVKKGIAACFNKFNEYQLAKYNRASASVKLRDALFMTHARPKDAGQEALFKRIANDELVTPDTWEVALSTGGNKAETFSRLMKEGKLGALAFLRNLRNMAQAGIPESEIRAYGKTVNVDRVLPFRYVAAAKHAPQLEDMLEGMMLRSLEKAEKLPGRTVLLVDVSGSMWHGNVSEKSELSRFDAAAALAMLAREICEEVAVYTFSYDAVKVIPRRGFSLREQLSNSQQHGGTNAGAAVTKINSLEQYDRIIMFTDEQSHDRVPAPKCKKAYVLNVASYQNGINNDQVWQTITGFSEATMDYIREVEKLDHKEEKLNALKIGYGEGYPQTVKN